MNINWTLVYMDDGIMEKGWYYKNAGDPRTYSRALDQGLADRYAALQTAAREAHDLLREMGYMGGCIKKLAARLPQE